MPADDIYSVSVRTLCEFTAKSGDLSVRFTPAPSAQQGIAGHQLLGARRGPGYQRELTLRGRHGVLRIRGRADGYDPAGNRLEEFKTHRGDLERMPVNQRGLHWAQLKIYGAMLCRERDLEAIDLSLVYLDIQSEVETCLTEHYRASHLQREFEHHCERFLAWACREMAHREARDRFLAAVELPHEQLRAGQRQMAEAVYRAAMGGRTVMVQAPTGIGKTLGSLFPLLKAAPRRGLDKLFFLVAKTSGRDSARHALDSLGAGAVPPALRVLELVAKETACEFPGRACEGASCPLARGFYDRLAAAREVALEAGRLERDTVRRVALAHQVCPYYLTQELIHWCDVIVGDYNYFFDNSAILHALTQENQWRIGLLVDEAHNLLARARDMYSARLEPEVLDAALRVAPASIAPRLAGLQRSWRDVHRAQRETYAVHALIPPAFLALLQRAATALADEMALVPTVDEALLRFYFQALHFCRMAEVFGDHSLFDVTQHGAEATRRGADVAQHRTDITRHGAGIARHGADVTQRGIDITRHGAPQYSVGATLCIRCVNPGAFLRARFAAGVTAALFSATLSPGGFYRTLLGLPASAAWINVGSPFDERQLDVRIESRISTRYHDRRRSHRPIVELMVRQYRSRPGNYLAYFSSFDYLGGVLRLLRESALEIPTWEQTRGMAMGERQAFLERFTPDSRGIGFAVLGGAFAEGIDLPGTRLIGAFIATLGLPQVNEVNTEIQRRMQSLFGSGFEYTYLYPGMQKVVQAAGRVIRTPSDQGTVILIDDRYRAAAVRELLPEWWRVQCGAEPV